MKKKEPESILLTEDQHKLLMSGIVLADYVNKKHWIAYPMWVENKIGTNEATIHYPNNFPQELLDMLQHDQDYADKLSKETCLIFMGRIYIYKEKKYLTVFEGRMKYNGLWRDCIVYKAMEEGENQSEGEADDKERDYPVYVKPRDEFFENYKPQ